MTQLSREQLLQEAQYQFPYHYIPSLDGDRFSQHRYWNWGMRYLGGLEVVKEEVRKLDYASLVDIGCGDGRFLYELGRSEPEKRLLGIDYSDRAIRHARAFAPDIDFRALDITRESVDMRFDVGTLIEVLEHIPPPDLPAFVESVTRLLVPEHTLIVTVPHANKRVTPKHYQHFTSDSLGALLEPHYADVRFVPFDLPIRRLSKLGLMKLMAGGGGRNFVVTNPRLWRRIYATYRKDYLYATDESRCLRIAAICRR